MSTNADDDIQILEDDDDIEIIEDHPGQNEQPPIAVGPIVSTPIVARVPTDDDQSSVEDVSMEQGLIVQPDEEEDDDIIEIIEIPAKRSRLSLPPTSLSSSFSFEVTPLMAGYSPAVLQQFARWMEEKQANERQQMHAREENQVPGTADLAMPTAPPPIAPRDDETVDGNRDGERREERAPKEADQAEPTAYTPVVARISVNDDEDDIIVVDEPEKLDDAREEEADSEIAATPAQPTVSTPIASRVPADEIQSAADDVIVFDAETRDDVREEEEDHLVVAAHADLPTVSTPIALRVPADEVQSSSMDDGIVLDDTEAGDKKKREEGNRANPGTSNQISPLFKTVLVRKISQTGAVEYHVKNVGDVERGEAEEKEEKEENEAEEKDKQWVVEKVMDKRTKQDGTVEYLLKWEDWEGEPTWEIESNCSCSELIEEFEKEAKKAEVKIKKRVRFSSCTRDNERQPKKARVEAARSSSDPRGIVMEQTRQVDTSTRQETVYKVPTYPGVQLATATKMSLGIALHKKNIAESRVNATIGVTSYKKLQQETTISEDVSRFILHCISFPAFPMIINFTGEAPEIRDPQMFKKVMESMDCLLFAVRLFLDKNIPLPLIRTHIMELKSKADAGAHLKNDGRQIPYRESIKLVAERSKSP